MVEKMLMPIRRNNVNLKIDASLLLETLKDFQKLIETFPESLVLFVAIFDPKSDMVKIEHIREGNNVVVRAVAETNFRDFVSTMLEKKKEMEEGE